MTDVNVHRDEWDRTNDRDGWRTRHMSVAKRLGAAVVTSNTSFERTREG